MMGLDDTVDLMLSGDYQDRFKAEYLQTAIRRERLTALLHRWDMGVLDFEPACRKDLLISQADAMDDYLHILEQRAVLEGIDLDI